VNCVGLLATSLYDTTPRRNAIPPSLWTSSSQYPLKGQDDAPTPRHTHWLRRSSIPGLSFSLSLSLSACVCLHLPLHTCLCLDTPPLTRHSQNQRSCHHSVTQFSFLSIIDITYIILYCVCVCVNAYACAHVCVCVCEREREREREREIRERICVCLGVFCVYDHSVT
jgi:hypothetical protein